MGLVLSLGLYLWANLVRPGVGVDLLTDGAWGALDVIDGETCDIVSIQINEIEYVRSIFRHDDSIYITSVSSSNIDSPRHTGNGMFRLDTHTLAVEKINIPEFDNGVAKAVSVGGAVLVRVATTLYTTRDLKSVDTFMENVSTFAQISRETILVEKMDGQVFWVECSPIGWTVNRSPLQLRYKDHIIGALGKVLYTHAGTIDMISMKYEDNLEDSWRTPPRIIQFDPATNTTMVASYHIGHPVFVSREGGGRRPSRIWIGPISTMLPLTKSEAIAIRTAAAKLSK